MLKEAGLPIDLVFCDSDVSGEMDGVMLARWIRDNRPETKSVLAENAARANTAVADECSIIEKPYDLPAVGVLIERLLANNAC